MIVLFVYLDFVVLCLICLCWLQGAVDLWLGLLCC